MSNPIDPNQFIPLKKDSQGNNDNILFYNSHASKDAIFECAMSRLLAISGLLGSLHELRDPPDSTLSAVASISTILISDANSLLQTFYPTITELE